MLSLTKHSGRLGLGLAVAIGVIAGHGIAIYYASSHMTLSVTAILGVVLLVVAKHLGLFRFAHALVRRAQRQGRR